MQENIFTFSSINLISFFIFQVSMDEDPRIPKGHKISNHNSKLLTLNQRSLVIIIIIYFLSIT